MRYLYFSLILLAFPLVFGEDCFVHDFGNDFKNVFSYGIGICGGMRPWVQDNFNSINIEPFHPYGESFVRPESIHSCIFSKPFQMAAGGKLQLNVYMNPTSSLDQIRILVYEGQASENIIVGELTSSISHSNFNQGWNTFEIILEGSETFIGYVAISGRTASDNNILIDSIRYLPPLVITEESEDVELDDDIRCPIYDTVVFQCVKFNFGEGYEMIFHNTNKICTNSETWEVVKDEVSGIRPKSNDFPSCISTPNFYVPSSGILKVNVSIISESYFDTILVAMNDDEDNIHSVAYNKLVTGNFESGLKYTLVLELKDIKKKYNAQISFVGFSTVGATVVVESFKFVPYLWDNQECKSLLDTRNLVINN